MARSFGIVLGEGTNATKVVSGSLSGVELQRSATRMFEFTVRHGLMKEFSQIRAQQAIQELVVRR